MSETTEALIERVLAEHRHPGEMLTVLGEAWLMCGCGERIDLPIIGGIVNGEDVARLYEAHAAAAIAEALAERDVRWGVVLDDLGSTDEYDTEDEARTALAEWGGERVVRIVTEEVTR